MKPGYENIEIGPAGGRLKRQKAPSNEVVVEADALHAVIVTALQVVEKHEVVGGSELLPVLQTTSQSVIVSAVTVHEELCDEDD